MKDEVAGKTTFIMATVYPFGREQQNIPRK